MATRNNGRAFEKLVAIIQEAYKDSPHTHIYTNFKIRDKFAKKKIREFDVFIITKINNVDLKIAIECKDYKKPVSIEKIEAFNSKCSTVSGISKKIIISPKGFQSGAIENAEQFDIELLVLSDVNTTTPISWMDVGSVTYNEFSYDILDYNFLVRDNLLKVNFFGKNIFNELTRLELQSGQLLHPNDYIDQSFGLESALYRLNVSYDEAIKSEPESIQADGSTIKYFQSRDIKHLYLILSGIKYEVISFIVDVKLIKVKLDTSTNTEKRIYSSVTSAIKGELISADFKNVGKGVVFYKPIEGGNMKIIMIDGDQLIGIYQLSDNKNN